MHPIELLKLVRNRYDKTGCCAGSTGCVWGITKTVVMLNVL